MLSLSMVQAVLAIGYTLCFLTSIPLTEAIPCRGLAKYRLTFKGEWTRTSHPQDFPSFPHFSPVVGCSHNSAYTMWKPGIKATTGVKLVAELGSTSAINSEMDEQISKKAASAKFQGALITSTGSTTVNNIEVNSQYPLVSFVSMIAPSPDWFVGVRDYSLCNETTGKWIDKRIRNLPPYDAGTDSGLRFDSPNQATNPPVDIFLITNTEPGSFQNNDPIKRFGTFTFEKTFETKPQTLPTSSNIKDSSNVPLTPFSEKNMKPSTTKVTFAYEKTFEAITQPLPRSTSLRNSSNVPFTPSIQEKPTLTKATMTVTSSPVILSASSTPGNRANSFAHSGVSMFLKSMFWSLFMVYLL